MRDPHLSAGVTSYIWRISTCTVPFVPKFLISVRFARHEAGSAAIKTISFARTVKTRNRLADHSMMIARLYGVSVPVPAFAAAPLSLAELAPLIASSQAM